MVRGRLRACMLPAAIAVLINRKPQKQNENSSSNNNSPCAKTKPQPYTMTTGVRREKGTEHCRFHSHAPTRNTPSALHPSLMPAIDLLLPLSCRSISPPTLPLPPSVAIAREGRRGYRPYNVKKKKQNVARREIPRLPLPIFEQQQLSIRT